MGEQKKFRANILRAATNISLITSWFEADLGPSPKIDRLPPSLFVPLREGFNFLDLYFVSHSEIAWFRNLCGMEAPAEVGAVSPTDFVASLSRENIDTIAMELRRLLHSPHAEPQQGIVTWRPRIVALATFFPGIAAVDLMAERAGPEHRFGRRQAAAVKALRRSLRLAHLLGAKVVEMVGGAGVPAAVYLESVKRPYSKTAKTYREEHYRSLAHAILEAYHPTAAGKEAGIDLFDNPIPLDGLPPVAVELEPGASFLLNSLQAFKDLRHEFNDLVAKLDDVTEKDRVSLRGKLTLNLDLAHAFMLGIKVDQLDGIPVGHVHVSDHAANFLRGGSHASDLVPGKFHTFEEYAPWIDMIVNKCSPELGGRNGNESPFSGFISIELEACNQVESLHSAMTTLRRWVRLTENNTRPAATNGKANLHGYAENATGFILTVDLGNSTVAALGKQGLEGARELAQTVDKLMNHIYREGGSIISFGGDGFIALFETGSLTDKLRSGEALRIIDEVLRKACSDWNPAKPHAGERMNLRMALHWGEAWILSSGGVRNQALSQDIVTSVRLCEELKRAVKTAVSGNQHLVAVAVTEEVHSILSPHLQEKFCEEHFLTTFRDGYNRARKLWYHKEMTTTMVT